jgi:hypothetical protein
LFNFQERPKLDPEKLNSEPPLIDTKPQSMKLIASKLMRKYGEEAFIHSQADLFPQKRQK